MKKLDDWLAPQKQKYNIYFSLFSTLYSYLWLSLFSLLAECNYLVVLCTWVTQLLWLKSLDLVPSCTYYYCLLSSVLYTSCSGGNKLLYKQTYEVWYVSSRPRFETCMLFVFTCFYQFLHDVIIKLFCFDLQNNSMIISCKSW